MANTIEAIGYSLGKLHAGLVSYLCALHSAGHPEPFNRFCEALGLPLVNSPRAHREYPLGRGRDMRVDLAISDGEAREPVTLLEIKVDDHESGEDENNWQTVRYSNASPNIQHRLFVTLGHGEYFHPPRSREFRWIRLDQFKDAVTAASQVLPENSVLIDWSAALGNEMNRRNLVFSNNRVFDGYRAGNWNIAFLGRLKEVLLQEALPAGIDPTCYTSGTAPDTILNFGWASWPLYAEINNNGRLNIKLNFDGAEDTQQRECDYQQNAARIQRRFGNAQVNSYNALAQTMTLLSLDIGLIVAGDGLLGYADGRGINATIRQLITHLAYVYGSE